jgi:hypothetical protein
VAIPFVFVLYTDGKTVRRFALLNDLEQVCAFTDFGFYELAAKVCRHHFDAILVNLFRLFESKMLLFDGIKWLSQFILNLLCFRNVYYHQPIFFFCFQKLLSKSFDHEVVVSAVAQTYLDRLRSELSELSLKDSAIGVSFYVLMMCHCLF